MIKNFIAFESKSTKQVYGWYKITLQVYELKKNIPNKIWQVIYYTSATVWDTSEVYWMLINKNIIPKKALDYSINQYTWPWYYKNDNPYCKITILN